ncbi:MAG: protoglobin domain-containing protein [Acidobacteriota bacterium]
MTHPHIPGYEFGSPALAQSPVSVEDFELLKKTVLFTDEDASALRRSREILAPQVEKVLDVWYGFVGANPHLVSAFCDPQTGQPDMRYLEAVRKRFGQWILDTASAEYGQAWLDYQHEIGLRHHRLKKNRTDGASGSAHVAFRYLIALLYPVTATLKPFLASGGASAEEVERMHQAWIKSVLLQVILWSHPYVKDGDF